MSVKYVFHDSKAWFILVHSISNSTVDQIDIALINSAPQSKDAICAF